MDFIHYVTIFKVTQVSNCQNHHGKNSDKQAT